MLYQKHNIDINSSANGVFLAPATNLPPETTISVSGTQGQNSYYNSAVTVSINGTDAHSGIQYSKYSFNAGQTWNRYTDPFSVEGNNTIIYYRSVDMDGNLEKTQKAKISVDMQLPSPPRVRYQSEQLFLYCCSWGRNRQPVRDTQISIPHWSFRHLDRLCKSCRN